MLSPRRWFAKNKDDGLIERELISDLAGFTGPTTNWKLTIVTGSDFGAGTDADVVVEIHGGWVKEDRKQNKSNNPCAHIDLYPTTTSSLYAHYKPSHHHPTHTLNATPSLHFSSNSITLNPNHHFRHSSTVSQKHRKATATSI